MDSADRKLYAVKVALVAAAYYGSAKLGLQLAFESGSVTAVWPPTGIALAAVVLWGYRIWPGVALGAFLANSWTGVPIYGVVGITVGNTLEALVGAFLLLRFADFRPSLERVRDVLALVGLAAVLSTTISATIGVLSLLASDQISSGQFGSVWRTWWLGDLSGDLIVAPALFVAATHWPFRRAPGRPLEAVVLTALVVGISLLIFSTDTPRTYLIYPPLVWAALRFGSPGRRFEPDRGRAAVAFTQNNTGPFAGDSPDDRLLLAQTFVGVAGITTFGARSRGHRAQARRGHRRVHRRHAPGEPPARPAAPDPRYSRRRSTSARSSEMHVVGGDFYDLFQVDDGSWSVVVGDACGKGVPRPPPRGGPLHAPRGRDPGAPAEPSARVPQRRDQTSAPE